MEDEIKRFLNLLGDNYYIFGGKALSKILKGVQSYDWDIIVDKNSENINSIKKKIDSVFDNVVCKPVSFTREYAGVHSTIYQCSVRNDLEELFDIKFEDMSNVPVVKLNGINYLDVGGLYFNLIESIRDNQNLLYDFVKMVGNIRDDYINHRIIEELSEIEEWIIEARIEGDEDVIQDYLEEMEEIKSPTHRKEVKSEISRLLDGMRIEKNNAERLIQKNAKRLEKLKKAFKNPRNFRLKYIQKLVHQCDITNNNFVKRIGDLTLNCEQIFNSLNYQNDNYYHEIPE